MSIYNEADEIARKAKGKRKDDSWLGHPMHPISIKREEPKTTRESTYVEEEFSKFLGEYGLRGGMSKSHVLRRLAILGAMSEGYQFDGQLEDKEINGGDQV